MRSTPYLKSEGKDGKEKERRKESKRENHKVHLQSGQTSPLECLLCLLVMKAAHVSQRFSLSPNSSQAPLSSFANRPALGRVVESSISAKIFLSQFSQSLPASVSDHLDISLTSPTLIPHQPPGLPSPRILSGWFSQNPPHSWYSCLLISPPLIPLLCSLALNSHFSLLYLELSPISCTVKSHCNGPHTYIHGPE